MFSRAARSLAPATKAARTAALQRAYSARPALPSSSSASRNAVIVGTTVAVGLLFASQQRVRNESVRESVLAQPSLKENVHSREGAEAPKTVTEPAHEAVEPTDPANQGAFNPETGEINWDCPCLGGMADGPCGEDFKAAFSCFVYSEAEPKGMDCVEKFKNMQDCFRRHPEIYAEEIDDEDESPAGSPLSSDHPDADKVPAPPTDEHPQNNAAMHVDPSVTPAKSPRRFA